jgi:hypothetical protein
VSILEGHGLAANGKLLPRHLAYLFKSGLSDEQILRYGFYSITDPTTVQKLLNWKWGGETLGPSQETTKRFAVLVQNLHF